MARGAPVSMILIILFAFISVSHAGNIITVDQSGHGDFYKIQDAINSIPANNKEAVTISINPGKYKETITVPPDKPFITLRGSTTKPSDVIITWDQSGDIVTVATFHVLASDFIARDVTFQNTFGHGHQAVALRVSGDRVSFYDCSIIGYQDTLFDETGRHYYENCYIEGVVDFIFGSATSFFHSCHIHSARAGFITAQRRETPTDNGGFVFFKGSITGEGGKTYLGRPWVGSYARVIFAYTNMENVIEPAGWSDDGIGEKELKAKSFCGQFKCDGPGATTSERVQWAREFSEEEISKFVTTDFINGKDWLKSSTPVTTPPPPSAPPPMKPSSPPPAPVVIPSSPPPAPEMKPSSPPRLMKPSSPPPPPVVIPSSPPPAPVTQLSSSPPPPLPLRVIITPFSPPSTSVNSGGKEGEPIIMLYYSGASSHSKHRFSTGGILALAAGLVAAAGLGVWLYRRRRTLNEKLNRSCFC
ncbi:PREDICTED: putative pectinesterase 11 [Fragaria vesca subsp. vesca]|uniref:putative pectinesterase 11 n=1 Tax=Fragaria vesca subsp. vesca TaxID=101020 RepID=UPI0002C34F0B|nr:PREDICTED: putative pectinesterase 11 [Fragaria vesca subsp. vesca]